MATVIGLSGKMGTGKTTVAKRIQYMAPSGMAYVKGFGNAVKSEVASVYGLPLFTMYDQQEKERPYSRDAILNRVPADLVAPHWRQQMTICPRDILQWYGTEYIRAKDPDYWVEKIRNWILQLTPDSIAIIDDVRFPNELDMIAKMGTCYRLQPYNGWNSGSNAQHESEISLDCHPYFVMFPEYVFRPKYGKLNAVAQSICKEQGIHD